MSRPHLHFTSLTPRELCGDIVESYRLAAERLGYPTSYADRAFHPGAINMLFFFWDVPWETIAPYHPDCIVVNFEPMVPGTHAWRDNYLGVLKHCYLWEYSQSNFQRNRELGLRVADYVPLAYEEDAAPVLPLDQVLPDAEQDIDVVFFGTLTQRRVDLLDALLRRGVHVVFTNGGESWSLEERDSYLRRAKLVLNFHNWDNSRVVEIGRLAILFRQRKAVVCELYPDSEIEPSLREAVAGAPYDALADTVVKLLADPAQRAALEREGLPRLRQLSQSAQVGPALERFLRWRSQQVRPALQGSAHWRIAACAHVPEWNADWAETFASLAGGHAAVLPVVTTPVHQADSVELGLAAAGFARARLLAVPPGIDAAAARNWAQHTASLEAEALLFCAPGQSSAPTRVQRLVHFLEAHPDVAFVTHWMGNAHATAHEVDGRVPELDHEIKAELFSPAPLLLGRCLVRTRFLADAGIRHDAEMTVHADLHFLCKCAAAGARFAALSEPLMSEQAPKSPPMAELEDPVMRGAMAARARSPWVRAAFAHLTQGEADLIGDIYAHLWSPDPEFASRLIAATAKACVHAPNAHGAERATLARVFRREMVRLITIFFQAGLVDQTWLDVQFSHPDIAYFLAPVSGDLPLRPTPIRN